MKKFFIKADIDMIHECAGFIERELTRLEISGKEIEQSIYTSENVLKTLIKHAKENSTISVSVFSYMGTTEIRIRSIGSKAEALEMNWNTQDYDASEDGIENDKNKLSAAQVDCKRLGKNNICTIRVVSKFKSLYLTLIGLVLGVISGLLLRNLSADASTVIVSNIFTPIYTMFMNALKLIVVPLVFFSIASSIIGFSDIKMLGKIAVKVLIFYVFTSLLAIGVGFLTGSLLKIGDPSLQSIISDSGTEIIAKSSSVHTSLKDMLVGIIPSDIINPFLNSDMLQIIFMAAMLGIATALIDSKGSFAKFVQSADKVVSKFASMIISCMPVAVFCSMAKMMIGMDIDSLLKVIVWVPSCFIGHLGMMIVYGILLFLLARYNPFKFFKLFMPAILTGYATGSSSATLPVSFKQCHEALKISPHIYSFSLPMGATINMDGSCITLVVTAMFASRIFGIELTPPLIIAMIVTILSLSMGSPGIPGGNLVCIAMLLPVINVPAETISLFMGLYSLVGMSQTATNVTGDAVVTTVIAKWENMIDS